MANDVRNLIGLPMCINWAMNIKEVVALTRITALLFNAKTENQRIHAQSVLKPSLTAS